MSKTQATYPDLAKKIVAITGGASGIGAAIVEAFHQQDAQVIFFDIDETVGKALVEKLGTNVHFEKVDLTDLDALSTAFANVATTIGGIDVLINNAAHDERHNIADVTPALWRERLSVNLDHQFFAAQAVIPHMTTMGKGAIVNMSSIAWRIGLDNAPAYVASKAAIEGLTHALAREIGPDGIRVNCILPGFVRTQRQVDKWLTPEFHETVIKNQCLKTLIEPEQVASVVLMLASDAASAITNQTLIVDAGWS